MIRSWKAAALRRPSSAPVANGPRPSWRRRSTRSGTRTGPSDGAESGELCASYALDRRPQLRSLSPGAAPLPPPARVWHMWLGRARGHLGLFAGFLAVLVAGAGASPPSAHGAKLLVLGRDGRAAVRDDAFLRTPAVTPAPSYSGARSATSDSESTARTVRQTLRRLRATRAITAAAYHRFRSIYSRSVAAARRLQGRRGAELWAVIDNVGGMAAAGRLTPRRLPAVFETLARNHEWWTRGPLLAPYRRGRCAGSAPLWA